MATGILYCHEKVFDDNERSTDDANKKDSDDTIKGFFCFHPTQVSYHATVRVDVWMMEYREEDEGLKGGVGSDSREEDDKKRDAECGVGENTWKCEQTATVLFKKKEVRVRELKIERHAKFCSLFCSYLMVHAKSVMLAERREVVDDELSMFFISKRKKDKGDDGVTCGVP